jgi:hypothetical protein
MKLMEIVSNAILTTGAIALLLSVGICLALEDRTATATSVLTFASLFVALLLLAKFKRLKMIGVLEAEMWEDKLQEAAVILQNLKEASARILAVKDQIKSTIRSGGPDPITGDKLQEAPPGAVLLPITLFLGTKPRRFSRAIGKVTEVSRKPIRDEIATNTSALKR